MLVSMLLEDILVDLGCVIVGPAARLEPAVEIAKREGIDAAFLDVSLAGAKVFPVADALAERGIPFVFVSGYGEQGLEPPYEGHRVIQKPFAPEPLGEALHVCFDGKADKV